MTASGENPPSVDDYACRFDFQAGWVNLTLDNTAAAEAIVLAGRAVRDFSMLDLQVSERDLLDDLVNRSMELNSDAPILAASYYGKDGVGLINLVVDSYGEEGVRRPSREDVQPLLLDIGNGSIVGDPDVSYPELAAGPAVRVQATVKTKRMLGFGSRIGEFIKYAVFPPDINQLVVITASWQDIAHIEELTQVTDELVSTMRNVPLDAEGQEIESGPLEREPDEEC